MSYENAPATLMLAQHCCICGKSLVDATSVELGIGPECRRKHGFNVDVDEEARSAANKLVHEAALETTDNDRLMMIALSLPVYGFERLARVLLDRRATVKVETVDENTLALETPYVDGFGQALRTAGARARWDGEAKRWLVPAGNRNQAWSVMRRFFPRTLGVGPRGPFVVKAA